MKPTRNLALDFLRGILIIIMIVDHFNFKLILGNIGFFSAADGFVFLSGIVIGIYSFRKIKETEYKIFKFNMFQRSLRVYKYQIFVLLFYIIINLFININYSKSFDHKLSLFSEFFWGSLLIYKPGGFDILPIYIVLLFLTPFIIKLICDGKILIVLVISIIVWALNLSLVDSRIIYWLPKLGIPIVSGFSIASWQLLFMLGISISYLSNKIELQLILRKNFIILISFSFIVFFFLLKNQVINIFEIKNLYKLTQKNNLGPLRILNFISFSIIINFIFHKFIPKKKNLIVLIGQNSIQIFTIHLLLMMIMNNFLPLNYLSSLSKYIILNDIINWSITLFILIIIPMIFYWFYRKKIITPST